MISFYFTLTCLVMIFRRSTAQYAIALLDGYPPYPMPNFVLPEPEPIPYVAVAPAPLPPPVPIVAAPIVPPPIVAPAPVLPPVYPYNAVKFRHPPNPGTLPFICRSFQHPHYSHRRTEVRKTVRTYERGNS
ncbi:hypothetical protein ANCDUO_20359 [Ancylostoma duodenale]|uniref:Uncharacterized protein n=1 Tax=Ancylostoma duodenale TaxID=51022 RepID=A0A0C2FXE2_9BILA|nr:hypothetical protein ANCDUO_20359 [Ancylostoma duodenale]